MEVININTILNKNNNLEGCYFINFYTTYFCITIDYIYDGFDDKGNYLYFDYDFNQLDKRPFLDGNNDFREFLTFEEYTLSKKDIEITENQLREIEKSNLTEVKKKREIENIKKDCNYEYEKYKLNYYEKYSLEFNERINDVLVKECEYDDISVYVNGFNDFYRKCTIYRIKKNSNRIIFNRKDINLIKIC